MFEHTYFFKDLLFNVRVGNIPVETKNLVPDIYIYIYIFKSLSSDKKSKLNS